MDASREIVGDFGFQANQVWLWGQGFQPQMPSFVDQTGCQAGPRDGRRPHPGPRRAHRHRAGRGAGRHGLVRHRLRGQARRGPAVAGGRRRPVPHPRRGHRRGRPRRQPRREGQGARGVGSAHPHRPGDRARCDGAVADAPAARPPDARRAEDAHHRLGALPAGRLGGRRTRRHLHRTGHRRLRGRARPRAHGPPRRSPRGAGARGRRRGRRRPGRGCSRRCARRTPAGRPPAPGRCRRRSWPRRGARGRWIARSRWA